MSVYDDLVSSALNPVEKNENFDNSTQILQLLEKEEEKKELINDLISFSLNACETRVFE